MNKKIVTFLLLTIILLASCSTVFAANTATEKVQSSKTTFEVVDKSICEINLNDMGKFTKQLTSYDKEKRELIITLNVTNTAKPEQTSKPVELMLVLDNSASMTKTYQNKKKMQYVTETANKFIDSLFGHFSNIKIGVVSFSSKDNIIDGAIDNSVLGTTGDATLLKQLSTSKDEVKSAVTSYATTTGPYTNIEAGLSLAQANFSQNTDTEKYIILLSDGVPNLSLNIDVADTITYSGVNAANTKKKLQAIDNSGIHLYNVLMGYYEVDVENPQAPLVQGSTSQHMTYGDLAKEVFGTTSSPTAGKFYYINYENLDTTINNDIYNSITYTKDATLKNIVIKDYIPQNIIDNFEFEYVAEPNIGTAKPLDTTDNSITWNIPQLKEGTVATVSYKLKLKETVDKNIINVILPTNTKVDIDFESPDGKGSVSSDVSPKVKLTMDNTTAKDPIPQTGNYTTWFGIIILIAIAVFAYIKVHHMNK